MRWEEKEKEKLRRWEEKNEKKKTNGFYTSQQLEVLWRKSNLILPMSANGGSIHFFSYFSGSEKNVSRCAMQLAIKEGMTPSYHMQLACLDPMLCASDPVCLS